MPEHASLRRLSSFVGLVCASLIVGPAAGAPGSAARTVEVPSVVRMVGQLMLVRMQGRAPSSSFVARIRRGEIGGVVLFADNFGQAGPAALVQTLQQAAKKAGQPPLLIAIDQEGGIVRRLPGAPSLAPRQMTSATTAKAQGLATARSLRSYGINVDLAPVLDVGHGGFIADRTFASTPEQVSTHGVAFAHGLSLGGVIATGKHFPGLGYAGSNTDNAPTIVRATAAQLSTDLLPYRKAVASGLKIVMVSTALYPALGVEIPAACSARVVTQRLREQLGFQGLVITDDLKTAGVEAYFSTTEAAVKAVSAGVDMVLAAGVSGRSADSTSEAVFNAILDATTRGTLSRQKVLQAYAHVLAVKHAIA